MPKKVMLYECDYCGEQYPTEKESINCLNHHNIIFQIEKLVGSHDCWGCYTSDWESTDKLFKNYESAINYIGNNKELRIKFLKLN